MVRRMESNYSSQNNVWRGDTESPAANGATRQLHVKGSSESELRFCFVLFYLYTRRDSAKTTLTALIYCVDLLKD